MEQKLFPVCLVYYTDINSYSFATFNCAPDTNESSADPKVRFRVQAVFPAQFKNETDVLEHLLKHSKYINLHFVFETTTNNYLYPVIWHSPDVF